MKPKLTAQQRAARAEIEAEMISERGGPSVIDVVTRDWIREYATLTVLIDAIDEAGDLTTRAAARRAALATRRDQVAARIRLEPSNRPATPSDQSREPLPGLKRLSLSALDLAKDLLKRHAAGLAGGESLTEYEQGQLGVLRSVMHGTISLPDPPAPPLPNTCPGSAAVAPTPEPDSAPNVSPAEYVHASEKREEEPRCGLCGAAASLCVERSGTMCGG